MIYHPLEHFLNEDQKDVYYKIWSECYADLANYFRETYDIDSDNTDSNDPIRLLATKLARRKYDEKHLEDRVRKLIEDQYNNKEEN